MEKITSQTLGQKAEQLACRFLQQKGLQLISTNYHCRFGEIDLIMRDEDILVFVEVRFRKNQNYGGGVGSVTKIKQQRLINSAQHYLQNLAQNEQEKCRFDVVTLDLGKSLMKVSKPEDCCINWLKDAFWEET